MSDEQAVKIVEQLVISNGEHLNDRDKDILKGSWHDLTYEQIKERYRKTFESCNVAYIKKILAHQLWGKVNDSFVSAQVISSDKKEKITKRNFRATINRLLEQKSLSQSNRSFDSLVIGDRYKVLTVLKQDKHSRVLLAEHLNYFNQQCIIKQLNSSSDCEVQTLEREARILRDIEEKTIQTPKFFGWFKQDGYWNLIYESIEGTPLSKEISSQASQKDEQEVKGLLVEILEIVDPMHRCNIVNRNIYPDNLIRRVRDKKLILNDFEIAKYLDNQYESLISAVQFTVNGYAAPEFISNPSPASDLYSIGKICIQALTGLTPNECRRQNHDWRKLVKVSRHFANVLDKMTSPNSYQRYQSSNEILNEL